MITPPTQKNPTAGTIELGDIPQFTQETVVVPPMAEPEVEIPPVHTSDFQATMPQDDIGVSAPAPDAPKPGNPWIKRGILIVILFVLIFGGIALGRMIMGMVSQGKEVTITYWGLWEDETIIRPVITAFQAKNPRIKVQYIKQSPKQYRERLQAAIARGEGPDAFRFHNTWVSMLRNDVSPAPQTVITTAQFQTEFYPVMANDLIGGNSVYGLPLMIDGLGLYYNEDLLKQAGIQTPPSTWEDVIAIVPKLTIATGNTFTSSAIALGTTNNVEHYPDILATMFMQNGTNLASPKGKEAEETLIFFRKFATPGDPLYTWNETMDNSIYAFATGKTAMMFAPSWRAFDIREMNPSLKFKIAPVPQLPGNTVTWASYWVEGVSAKSTKQQEAWEFVRFLTSKEGAVLTYSEAAKSRGLFGEPYARVELASTLETDPYVGAYITQAKDARSFPLSSRTFDNGINDKLIIYLQNAVNAVRQGSSPTQELETMSSGFNQIFASYGLVSNAAPQTTQ